MADNLNLVTLSCPNCGATISLPENSKFGYCEYCNSQLRYDDGSREYRVADQSEIDRILLSKDKKNLTEQIHETNLEHETKSLVSVQTWTILVIVFHALFILLIPTIKMFKSVASGILVIVIWVVLPIILAVLKPRNAPGSKIGVLFLFFATFAFLFYAGMAISQKIF